MPADLAELPAPLNDNDGTCSCGAWAIPSVGLCICCGARAGRPCERWSPCCCRAAGNGHCVMCGWRRGEH